MRRYILAAVTFLSLSAGTASAQPHGRMDRDGSRADVMRSRHQVRDDWRDLVRFEQTLAAFDNAMARRDPYGVRNSLQSFVFQGRREVAEQQRETQQAAMEARRSVQEARRDGTWKDMRDARDDRRDFFRERRELIEEANLLNELERIASAEVAFGPQANILMRARQVMVRFVELARVELVRSQQELREDRRELREDRWDGRRGRRW